MGDTSPASHKDNREINLFNYLVPIVFEDLIPKMKASIYCIFALFVINANASPWAHRLLRSDDDKEQMIVDAPSAIVDGPSAYSSVVLQRDEKRSDVQQRDEKRSYFLLRDDKRSDVQQRDEKRSDELANRSPARRSLFRRSLELEPVTEEDGGPQVVGGPVMAARMAAKFF